jgi:hypothetical protein
MSHLTPLAWDECLRLLRRAGFCTVAESPTAVMLAGHAGHSIFLHRAPTLDHATLQAACHPHPLSQADLADLLSEAPLDRLRDLSR